MNIKYFVELTAEEREQLFDITKKGRQSACVVKPGQYIVDGR